MQMGGESAQERGGQASERASEPRRANTKNAHIHSHHQHPLLHPAQQAPDAESLERFLGSLPLIADGALSYLAHAVAPCALRLRCRVCCVFVCCVCLTTTPQQHQHQHQHPSRNPFKNLSKQNKTLHDQSSSSRRTATSGSPTCSDCPTPAARSSTSSTRCD